MLHPSIVAKSKELTPTFLLTFILLYHALSPKDLRHLKWLTQSTGESFYSLLLIELRACQGENLKTRNLIKGKHLSLYRPITCFVFNPKTAPHSFLICSFMYPIDLRLKCYILALFSLDYTKSSPPGNYISMETWHSHVRSKISVRWLWTMTSMYVMGGRAKDVCRGVCSSDSVIEKLREWRALIRARLINSKKIELMLVL